MKIDPPAGREHPPDFGEERVRAVAGLQAVARRSAGRPCRRRSASGSPRPGRRRSASPAGQGITPCGPGISATTRRGVGEKRPKHRRREAVAGDRHVAGVRPELAQRLLQHPLGRAAERGAVVEGAQVEDILMHCAILADRGDCRQGRRATGRNRHAARDRHRPLSERQLCLSPPRRGDRHGGAGRRAGGGADRGGAEGARLAARPHPDHPPPCRPRRRRWTRCGRAQGSWVPRPTGRGCRRSISPSAGRRGGAG